MTLKDLSEVLDTFADAYVVTEIYKSTGTEIGFWWDERHNDGNFETYINRHIDFISTDDDSAKMVIYLK